MKHRSPYKELITRYLNRTIAGLLVCFSLTAFSQTGNPFITNFKLPEGVENQNWAIVQDNSGMLFFANRKGILTFDGLEWDFVNRKDIPYYLIYEPVTERVFAGCYGSYGYLGKNNFGNFDYHVISSEFSEVGVITNILFDESHLYFYSDQTISRLAIQNFDDKEIWRSENDHPFTGMALLNGKVYVNIHEKGLYVIDGNSFLPVPGGDLIDRDEILFSLPFNERQILIATDNSFLYLFDGTELTDYIIEDENYIMESVLCGGVTLHEQDIALATLTGGCLIIKKESGETQFTLNYQTGLPDDEIYAIGKDQSNGLWLSHEFGASRIDFSVPVWSYSSYPGLEGNLIAVLDFNNTIYVASSEGIYFLNEVKDYKEIEILVKKREPLEPLEVRKTRQPARQRYQPSGVKQETQQAEAEQEQEEESKKGLLSRLFRKKGEEEQEPKDTLKRQPTEMLPVIEEPDEKPSEVAPSSIQDEPVAQYTTHRTYALQSISHKFTKIENLDDKCRQLVQFRDQILVATNTGLYRIQNNEVKFIATYTYIHYIHPSQHIPGLFYVGTPEGAFTVNFNQGEWEVNRNFFPGDEPVYSIYETPEGIWLGSETKAFRLSYPPDQLKKEATTYLFPSEYSERVIVRGRNQKPVFLLSTGCYVYDPEKDELVRSKTILPGDMETYHYICSEDGSTWVKDQKEWIPIHDSTRKAEFLTDYLRLFDGIQYIYTDGSNNTWVIDENNLLSKIEYPEDLDKEELFNVYFKSINSASGWNFTITRSQFTGGDFPLEFRITAPYFIRSELTQYQYLLEGLNQDWSKWKQDPVIDFDFLPPNDYQLHIRARNILGSISDEKTIHFTIEPPFTRSVWFMILIGIGAFLALYVLIIIRERKLRYDKKILEQKVKERTAEIEEQKEEIKTQRDEIEKQRDEISLQKQEITDSIHYAQRIQDAILPPEKFLDTLLPEHFILFKPRDIVSGDFYWVAHRDDKIYIAAADCTGHGVSGAFMSMLGHSFLNEIVNNYKISKPGQMLNRLRTTIIKALHQTGKMDEAKDGLDIALCILQLKEKKVLFSGAYNPLIMIRNSKLTEIRGDRMPIGIHFDEKRPFNSHELEVKKRDTIYLFSDGYIDQFGGSKGTKFKLDPFKKLLLSIQDRSMEEQKRMLDERLKKWRGKYDQVDDILVIGFKV